MTKPTVLLDVDGILADFITPALALVKRLTGATYEHDDISTWEIFDSMPEAESVKDMIYKQFMTQRGYCRSIPVYPCAKEGVRELQKVADVVVVTSPFWGSPTWMHERQEWLQEHFGIDKDDVIHARRKHRIMGDVFVDDKASHVVDWAIAHPDKRAILWPMLYNESDRDYVNRSRVVRMLDVDPRAAASLKWERLVALVSAA